MSFAPTLNEIAAIQNGLLGWKKVGGLGPSYFVPSAVERELLAFMLDGRSVSQQALEQLARQHTRVNNFFSLLSPEQSEEAPQQVADLISEADSFLSHLEHQVTIWRDEAFRALDFSRADQELYFKTVAATAPVLFNMGFVDAIPHSAQVSRLTASMAQKLGGRHSEIVQSAICGWLHDPKFHPELDLAKQNLATHPVTASALASTVFQSRRLFGSLVSTLSGNRETANSFVAGLVDALGVNNDSRFVQMMVVLPLFMKQVEAVYGQRIAEQLKDLMERRLESTACGVTPPPLPQHLRGLLSQIRLDSGFRGISRSGWIHALNEAGISSNQPIALFNRLLNGDDREITGRKLVKLKESLSANRAAILRCDVQAVTLLHHHQEVCEAGRCAAEALVIADPMMLSAHKVAAVYTSAMIDRLKNYCASFDDNIRLLPLAARRNGKLWQRAVYQAMLDAADRLTGRSMLHVFKTAHIETSTDADIDDLRVLILQPQTWREYAEVAGSAKSSANVRHVLSALESAYVDVTNQYRYAAYSGNENSLATFYPKRG